MGEPNFGANFRIHREAAWLGAFPSAKFWKPAQNINKTCTSLTDHQPRTAAFPRRFSEQNQLENRLPWRLNFPRFLAKSVAFPLVHFFCNIFRTYLPLFLSGQDPQKQKCNTFAAPFAPLAAAPKDRPSAIKMMNRSPPQKLSKIGKVRASPPAPASQHAHMKASQNSDELSYISTNNNTAANPQSDLLQKRRQFPRLASVPTPNLDCTR